MKPDPLTLFMQYHLGLKPDGSTRFCNLNDLAREYAVAPAEVQQWLVDAKIDAATAEDIDYDLAGQHGEAQILALTGGPEATLDFARRVWSEYQAKLGTKRVRRYDDDTLSDADGVAGDPPKK